MSGIEPWPWVMCPYQVRIDPLYLEDPSPNIIEKPERLEEKLDGDVVLCLTSLLWDSCNGYSGIIDCKQRFFCSIPETRDNFVIEKARDVLAKYGLMNTSQYCDECEFLKEAAECAVVRSQLLKIFPIEGKGEDK